MTTGRWINPLIQWFSAHLPGFSVFLPGKDEGKNMSHFSISGAFLRHGDTKSSSI